MILDWMAAARAYEGKWPDFKNWEWLNKNWGRITKNISPKTQEDLNYTLFCLGIKYL